MADRKTFIVQVIHTERFWVQIQAPDLDTARDLAWAQFQSGSNGFNLASSSTEIIAEPLPAEASIVAVVERRRSVRIPMFNTGYVLTSGLAIPCVIRNLSHHGAKLITTKSMSLPQLIELQMDDDRVSAAKVIWRSAEELGVEFTTDQS